MLKFLLNCSLERTGLISFCTKLASERSLSGTELQKHDDVRLWQAHIRLLAPLQTETLKMTFKMSDHVLFLSQKERDKFQMVEQRLTGLALVKATPEKAYLSTTKVVPCSSFFFIKGL